MQQQLLTTLLCQTFELVNISQLDIVRKTEDTQNRDPQIGSEQIKKDRYYGSIMKVWDRVPCWYRTCYRIHAGTTCWWDSFTRADSCIHVASIEGIITFRALHIRYRSKTCRHTVYPCLLQVTYIFISIFYSNIRRRLVHKIPCSGCKPKKANIVGILVYLHCTVAFIFVNLFLLTRARVGIKMLSEKHTHTIERENPWPRSRPRCLLNRY